MLFRAELGQLSPYDPPKATAEAEAEHGSGGFVKLTSNELSFGPLVEAEAAIAEAMPRANRYPDRYAREMREAVAKANPGASLKNVLVGNGSSEVLQNLLMLLERPGKVISPWPSFGLFRTICITLGLDFEGVPLADDYSVDIEALLGAITDETRAVILCNPNNPTGAYLKLAEVERFADALPDDVLLILDEAYQEFVADPEYHGAHELALSKPNVAVCRTFAKAHGLAGLRVGYGIAPERVADYAERVRFPFSVNLASQVAATASMHAKEKIQARADMIVAERNRIQDAFAKADLEYVPSEGNFILVRIGPEVFEANGVLVREGDPLGFPGWSRVTVGKTDENDLVIGALK